MTFDEEEAAKALRDAQVMNFTGDEISVGGSDPMDIITQVAEAPPTPSFIDMMGGARNPGAIQSQMAPRMANPGASDVTLSQRADAASGGGGFDWARALYALGRGNLSEFDAQRNHDQARGDAQAAQFEAKQIAKEGMDPQSPMSRARQQEYASTMAARAKIAEESGMGQLAKMFAEQAQMAPTMSATQIERASQNYGGLMKESIGAMDAMAKRDAIPYNREMKEREIAARELQAKNTGAQGWARIAGDAQERDLRHQEREDARAEKRDAANAKKQEALPGGTQVDEHIEATQTAQDIKRALELLPRVSYIGAGAKAANAVAGALPNALDPRTDVDREFANLVQSISAPERHRLFGSALSKGEDIVSQELLPSLGKNPKTVAEVLTKMGKNVGARVGKQRTLYPGLNKIADFSAGGQQSSDPRVELAKKALSDPAASEAHKAAAKRILEQAGQ